VGVTLDDGASQIPKLSEAVNHTPTLVGWYQDFSEPLNGSAISRYIKAGQTPIITWEPQKVGDRIPDNYPLSDIASGKFDSYLIRSATTAKAVGGKFVMRFAHEMNGYWYPWGQPKANDPRSYATKTNTPAAYVAAYQHIHDLFQEQGVRNVYWMWSPNLIDSTPNIALSSLYPGDSYVDVVGLSGYLHGADQTYTTKYGPTIKVLNLVAPEKPIIIAEGAVDNNINRVAYVADLLNQISHTPRVQGFLWLNKTNVAFDYTVDKDQAALAAIRLALTKPPFIRTAGPLQAIAEIPTITGTSILGNTLSAQGSYRGTARSTKFKWFVCDTATQTINSCRVLGQGAYHVLSLADLHKYLRVRFTTASPFGYDSAISAPSDPVLNVPAEPEPPTVNLRGVSTQLQFPTPRLGSTNLMLRVDGGAPIYLPASTTEYWITGLTVGTDHTFAETYADIMGSLKSEGPAFIGTFTAMSSSPTPTVTVSSKAVTIALPPTTTGQTGWEYTLDSGPYQSAFTTDKTITTEIPVEGSHTFGIRRVSADGRTLTKTSTYVIQAAPAITAINLRGTSTQLTFGTAPTGVTHLVVRVDNGDPVYIPIASGGSYWITNLVKGQSYHVSVTYKYGITGFTGEGWHKDADFVALSTPVSPLYRIDGNALTLYLPDLAAGQTGWKYSLDGATQVKVSANIQDLVLQGLSVGSHRLTLRALGGDGETQDYPVSFTIIAP